MSTDDETPRDDLGYGAAPEPGSDDDENVETPLRLVRPSPEDEAWRAQSSKWKSAAVAKATWDGLRHLRVVDDADVERERAVAAGGPLRCKRCGEPTPVLLQPRGYADRSICGACSGKEWRAVAEEQRAACAAYKSPDPAARRGAAEALVRIMGRVDAAEWMRAVDAKRGGPNRPRGGEL